MNEQFAFNEDICSRFIGYPICAVLNDGARHFGVVSKVGDGRMILNDNAGPVSSAGTSKRTKGKTSTSLGRSAGKSRKNRGTTNGPARLSAYPDAQSGEWSEPLSPFSQRVTLELKSIAGLYPLL
ncbi:hypothetical protein FE783_25950 [Paenibacillus mesophilus]|uniref:hypothetical protein n=1 Tax=Paenibacillus mesophilus TaxID=2582849 RepID=UPI00110DB26C|nr:hypothetical protein [Paenibacillus mesophilus]TMV46414.1 hypothetical protein FE783_25950 [Paenibacillus mesophilus]